MELASPRRIGPSRAQRIQHARADIARRSHHHHSHHSTPEHHGGGGGGGGDKGGGASVRLNLDFKLTFESKVVHLLAHSLQEKAAWISDISQVLHPRATAKAQCNACSDYSFAVGCTLLDSNYIDWNIRNLLK